MAVPESIRATAIETAARTFPGWNEDTEDGDLTAHWEKVNQTCREQAAALVDAVLPAVVAQVQADTLEAAQKAIAGEDAVEWARSARGSTISLVYAIEVLDDLAAEYREKGENHA